MGRSKISIHSYQKAWEIEQKIYNFFNWALPVPISLKGCLYFIVILIIVLVLNFIIPLFHDIPIMLKYAIFPVLTTQLLLKLKLDGKYPQRYLVSLIKYIVTRFEYIERFQGISPSQDADVRLSWSCSRGMEQQESESEVV